MIKDSKVPLKGDLMTAKSYLLGGAAAFALVLAGCSAPTASDGETTETPEDSAEAALA